ncbi:hypothetical protein CYLTODRAFT_425207 [Cylindrobasidium torrendii FP15055 ss-10]|uniref:Uncharacterized protein n=1 Tax=Cylindrobasidium torrendii FP15055 ss-10 TaxID=1314674 RepID=A0A0D7B2Q2_9AGAR|nr:hypothetical protein CYLTODRAFT_425207 [Cylindrobasidium torrendii FP15055 ss-10]
MLSSFAFLVAFAAAGANAITVTAPSSAVMCNEATVSWSGGEPPFEVRINAVEDSNDSLVFYYAPNKPTGTSVTHPVCWESGREVFWTVEDSQGEKGKSSSVAVEVNPDGNDDCLD